MNKFDNYFKTKKEDLVAPEGYCPNCWGRQEYKNQFFKAIHNEASDLKTIEAKRGWIDNYFNQFLQGIKIRSNKNNELICESCKISYKVES